MAQMQQQSLDTMAKADLLRQVQMHHFAMHDLALYLDTHPTDETALEHFMQHKSACEQASGVYVSRFGALKMEQVQMEDGWAAWSNTPWPWDREAN